MWKWWKRHEESPVFGAMWWPFFTLTAYYREDYVWALLGAFCRDIGLWEEAHRALLQSRWLRLRAGEVGRARVVERLANEVAAAAA